MEDLHLRTSKNRSPTKAPFHIASNAAGRSPVQYLTQEPIQSGRSTPIFGFGRRTPASPGNNSSDVTASNRYGKFFKRLISRRCKYHKNVFYLDTPSVPLYSAIPKSELSQKSIR